MRHLRILGTRGVPAAHGGFETFAEAFARHLVARGWSVTVYCQAPAASGPQREDVWEGVRRVHLPAPDGPLGTMSFDWASVAHARREPGVCLVLGYNTAAFLAPLRAAGHPILLNMDGLEWKRSKWSAPVRAWFFAQEWIGARIAHRLVADHPRIADHVATRRDRASIVVIPYGAEPVTSAPTAPVEALGLSPGRYLVSIARIEPENNILAMVEAFVRRGAGLAFAVLGKLDPTNAYHRAVRAAADGRVLFPGAIYETPAVQALRFHARAYCHGHSVGGTNPSLVESLWCGNAVLAHDNPFNRWTAGPGQFYFTSADDCASAIGEIAADDGAVAAAGAAARARAAADFAWADVLGAYEREIETLDERARGAA
jgi:glycosyltransferase involved in cell wall biosynthesis